MARKQNIMENKKHTLTKKMERKLNNVKNETQTLFDLDYGKKH
uniref:Uncharacterized protein n=1 Tax=Trichinella nativa TaxID=6335 RepID=A0A0V1KIQ0_9BILA